MKKADYSKAIESARELVRDIEEGEIRITAFGIVLQHLLGEASDINLPEDRPHTSEDQKRNAVKGELTPEELSALFETDENSILKLKVRPTGDTIDSQQQTLAHAVLMGYHKLLGKNEVKATVMGEVARYWNLSDKNFSKSAKTSSFVQARGKGKGLVYSFRPGAVAKLTDEMRKMAYGE